MRSFLLFVLLTAVAGASNAQRECASGAYTNKLIASNPELEKRLAEIQQSVTHKILNKQPRSTASGVIQGNVRVIRIPVVVHVVYHSEAQNISDAQIHSQIEALNKDFRKLNSDISLLPPQFESLAADCYIEFQLANVDHYGKATNGIVRRKTHIEFFGLDDRIKSSAIGGSDPWDADRYLNIWIGNIAGGIIGYSSPLGGPKDKDGVVIRSSAFGTINTAAPFNKGRTATHEIGHWLGLQHIWGDMYCGDDNVDDTPKQQSATRGCPSGTVISCTNKGNMYMNFMDLTNDACMYMFTQGQKQRMLVAFEPGGVRHALLSSDGCSGTPTLPEELPTETETKPTVQIYPNPVRDMLQLSTDDNGEDHEVKIYNHLGQLMMQARISRKLNQLNVSKLRGGMYFITIGERKKAYKFVKGK
jgi:hypothetical protein